MKITCGQGQKPNFILVGYKTCFYLYLSDEQILSFEL